MYFRKNNTYSNHIKTGQKVQFIILSLEINIFFSLSFTGLFVFGGYSNVFRADVEILNLSPSQGACPRAPSLPYSVREITAATVDGLPVQCGGFTGNGQYASIFFPFLTLGGMLHS